MIFTEVRIHILSEVDFDPDPDEDSPDLRI